jgi:aminocarboxymuconate-semialdehyde decarboxylase
MEIGLSGASLATNVNGRQWDEPDFEPLFAAAESLGALLFFHANRGSVAPHLPRYHLENTIGHPVEDTIAAASLIFGGVLERHPDLKILAVHGGGFLPAYSGRIDHAWGARSDVRGSLPNPPTSYLKRIYFDTVVFTPHQLDNLVRVFGVDRIIMGTDYPYDMAEYDPIEHVASAGLDAASVAAIVGSNARKLLKL